MYPVWLACPPCGLVLIVQVNIDSTMQKGGSQSWTALFAVQTVFHLTRTHNRQTGHSITPFYGRFKRPFYVCPYQYRGRVILSP